MLGESGRPRLPVTEKITSPNLVQTAIIRIRRSMVDYQIPNLMIFVQVESGVLIVKINEMKNKDNMKIDTDEPFEQKHALFV